MTDIRCPRCGEDFFVNETEHDRIDTDKFARAIQDAGYHDECDIDECCTAYECQMCWHLFAVVTDPPHPEADP